MFKENWKTVAYFVLMIGLVPVSLVGNVIDPSSKYYAVFAPLYMFPCLLGFHDFSHIFTLKIKYENISNETEDNFSWISYMKIHWGMVSVQAVALTTTMVLIPLKLDGKLDTTNLFIPWWVIYILFPVPRVIHSAFQLHCVRFTQQHDANGITPVNFVSALLFFFLGY